MRATRGRASFLGERSVGHMDPGARSASLMIGAVCDEFEGQLMANVGIVIVSHSPKVAEGAAEMVRQMVGDDVPLAWTGGDFRRRLGNEFRGDHGSDRTRMVRCRSCDLVDLGGAETNSEMAIEALPAAKRKRVVICNAPIVEGAVIAATEASGGSDLETVRRVAEELSP